MNIFDKLASLLKQGDSISKAASDGVKQARDITKMIPGDKDDKLVEGVAKTVEDATKTYDGFRKNIPGKK